MANYCNEGGPVRHAPATGIRTYGRSVNIVPWATPVLHPVGLGGARAWFCCCGSFWWVFRVFDVVSAVFG